MQLSKEKVLSLLSLKGVGPRVEQRLSRLSIFSIEDLLFHLPLRYEDRTRVVPIGSLRHGDECVVQGEVQLTQVKFGRRRMLLSKIHDGSGSLTLRFFNFNASQKNNLSRGSSIKCYGTVRKGAAGLEMIHPEYEYNNDNSLCRVNEYLTAIYPTTEGLHQLSLRKLSEQVLELLTQKKLLLPEYLPQWVLQKKKFPSLDESLLYVHRPPPDAPVQLLQDGLHYSQQRLAFEELLAHNLSLQQFRCEMNTHNAIALAGKHELHAKFIKQLDFSLTQAQQRVVAEITTDLSKTVPMQRLLQGDVGSGKTVVAALAALSAVEQGYQVAIMAPTEILAEQHLKNFERWFSGLSIRLGWLSGKMKVAAQRSVLQKLVTGDIEVLIGTHALFQQQVTFKQLALVIVDEQHRFGVHQRLALREKGKHQGCYPHQLIMTATPIPRTLAMTHYADLDCSIIDELPAGRKPVETVVLSDSRRASVVERVHHACKKKRQVYWVCALIEESESLQCEAAQDTATKLAEALVDVKVGLIHGRLKTEEKNQVMAQFKQGVIELLVATTVIEVGVDVPNASLMIIENAERFGLAQLHQLRGRVGRGEQQSVCVLMYHGPLSKQGNERLAVMRESNDGFYLAQKDLELRGSGELLGTRQTGMWQLKIADLQRDSGMLESVRKTAVKMTQQQCSQITPLIKRWMGDATRYGNV